MTYQHNKQHARPTDWAYLAGLIDGDGSINIRRRDKPATRTDRKRGISFIPLVTICGEVSHIGNLRDKFFGIGNIYNRPVRPDTNRPLAEWTIAGGQAREVFKRTIPFLILKKPQASLALSMPQPKSRWGLTPELRATQEKCWREVKCLNHRYGRGKEAEDGR